MIEEYLTEDKFKNHAISWKSLQESKEAKDVPSSLPKLIENIEVLSWFHQVDLTLVKIIGHGYVPLAYVIQKDQTVTIDPPEQLLPGKCYSDEHGSLQNELIARYYHYNAYFDENNQMLLGLLQNSLRGCKYSANLTEFEKSKNGCRAYFQLAQRFGGTQAWESAHNSVVTA